MRIRVLPVLLLLVLAGLFAVINWTTFTTPTTLNLGVAMVEAPLGMVMLGFIGLIALVYIVTVVGGLATALSESRRMNRELAAQRELADKAEASRITELRDFFSAELLRVTSSHDDLQLKILSRMEQSEQRARTTLEETANTLSACIGELEDRLDLHRTLPGEAPPLAGDVPPPTRDYRAR